MARGQHQRASPQQMRTHPPGSEPRAWKTGSRLRSGPLICPPFCHVCRASGQQCVSLAICKGGAAAGGGSVRKRAMCKRQASPQTADCLSSLEPGFSSLYRAKLVEPRARLRESGARLPSLAPDSTSRGQALGSEPGGWYFFWRCGSWRRAPARARSRVRWP